MMLAATLVAALAGTPFDFDKTIYHVEKIGTARWLHFFKERDIVTLDGSVKV